LRQKGDWLIKLESVGSEGFNILLTSKKLAMALALAYARTAARQGADNAYPNWKVSI